MEFLSLHTTGFWARLVEVGYIFFILYGFLSQILESIASTKHNSSGKMKQKTPWKRSKNGIPTASFWGMHQMFLVNGPTVNSLKRLTWILTLLKKAWKTKTPSPSFHHLHHELLKNGVRFWFEKLKQKTYEGILFKRFLEAHMMLNIFSKATMSRTEFSLQNPLS